MSRRRRENPVRPLNRAPFGLDSVTQDAQRGVAPFAHLNEQTDFPDDMMTDAERAAIEADERRREAGLPAKKPVSHIEHGKIKTVRSVKRRRSMRDEDEGDDEDDGRSFDEALEAEIWDIQNESKTATPVDDDTVRQVWLRAQRMTQ